MAGSCMALLLVGMRLVMSPAYLLPTSVLEVLATSYVHADLTARALI